MKHLFFAVVLSTLYPNLSFAAEPNFSCNIFGDTQGSLTLSGTDPLTQSYEIKISQSNSTKRTLTGTVQFSGQTQFTALGMDTQKAIINAMEQSSRGNLKTGNLVVFANTKDLANSTLTISLMPTGEIAYLQIGVLQVFCM